MAGRPTNIGIKAIEIYFPSQVCPLAFSSLLRRCTLHADSFRQCVEQSALEKFDGVSEGKYTIGLGQTKMSFCDDREGECGDLLLLSHDRLTLLPTRYLLFRSHHCFLSAPQVFHRS